VIKKIQEGGAWRFVSLKREGKRYVEFAHYIWPRLLI